MASWSYSPTAIQDTLYIWKYIAFGPDEKLYVPVGAPCNICESEEEIFNTITRLDIESGEVEIVQRGIRNAVGFNWHPDTDELWFTDNGRDYFGDDLPADELNHASKDYLHFGYPYCHQGDTPDPEIKSTKTCDEFTPPFQNLGAHVAALGMEFNNNKMFPNEFANKIFIAEHGSWNRSKRVGYRISMVDLDNSQKNTFDHYQPFISGWLKKDESIWGRPVDLEWMPDGSMLISDDMNDAIYRVTYGAP